MEKCRLSVVRGTLAPRLDCEVGWDHICVPLYEAVKP